MTAPIVISEPRKGFYKARLAPKALPVGVMIWHGRPVIEGRMLDRSPRWCCAVDGATDRDIFDVWPWCCDERIGHSEFAFLKRRARWARKHAPDHPAANPRKPIDRRKLPPLIGGG